MFSPLPYLFTYSGCIQPPSSTPLLPLLNPADCQLPCEPGAPLPELAHESAGAAEYTLGTSNFQSTVSVGSNKQGHKIF